MDKTFNDLMDIVNRTKKIDGGDRPRSKPRPRPQEYEEEEYTPREYDVVEETPKRKRTVKTDSPSLFGEESAINKLVNKNTTKSTTKKTPAKSSTTKATTKTPAKKTATKSTATKTKTAPKETTPKVSKPKLTKEDILSEIKVVSATKKATTPKKETPTVDVNDPKNAQLYQALHNSLFSGGTDISEYMESDSQMSDTQSNLQELRAKREAEKINAEITKEQQEYEQLFTGSLGSVFSDVQEEEIVEEVDKKEEVNVAEKNAKLQSELNAIKANLENKKNGVAPQPTPVQKTENRHDATFELETGNRDLDKKIAEYYRRKQEKINQYKASMEEGLVEEDNNTEDEGPVDYEAIFGGSMMTRDQLLGIEREPEEDATEELVETPTTEMENEQPTEMLEEDVAEPVVDNTQDEISPSNNLQESSEEEEVIAEESQAIYSNDSVQEETATPDESEVLDGTQTQEVESVEVEETPVENTKEEHIKSLLSDLLFNKRKSEENANVVEESVVEPQVEAETSQYINATIDNTYVRPSEEINEIKSEEERRADYESIWNDTLLGGVEKSAETDIQHSIEGNREQEVMTSSIEEMTTVQETAEVEDTEEDIEEELSEEELLDSLTLNVGGMSDREETPSVEERIASSMLEEDIEVMDTPNYGDEPEEIADRVDDNSQFVLVDTPQIFGNFDEDNKQEVTPYVDRTPVRTEDEDVESLDDEEETPIMSESFDDEEVLGLKVEDEETEDDVYNLSSSEDMSDYILSSNIPTEERSRGEEYDEHFESVVSNERVYENARTYNVDSSLDDEEDNTYVVDTLPENRYDILGNEVRIEEDDEEEEVVIEEKKDDTISKEEFYNEMARLQENLINQLKGNAQTEGRDLFEEKVETNDDVVESIVDELIEKFEEDDIEDEVEEVVDETPVVEEVANEVEEVVCKAEPVDPEHFDDYNLLNKEEPLNDDDLAFQEKSEEEKEPEKDVYFYASAEDNEKKSAVVDEFMTIYDEETPAIEKEVGDINIFKNIGNATPSSEILKEVKEKEVGETSATVNEDEVEAIYTLMGISRKPVTKPQDDMKVLYVASECQPFIASGGLGDVAGSLPKAIAKKGGVDIRVIMPLYGTIKQDYRDKFEYLGNFTVHLSWRQEYCGLFRYYMDGVTYYFIDNERYFKRDKLYGYYDDGERFAYFSKAIVEALPYLNFFPDIIHCNDWQSSLVSAYIKTCNWSDFRYYKIKNIYTIHNVEYQGVYGMENLKDLFGIDYRFRNDMEYNGDINLTKAAIQYSDKFTTVSHSYCDNLKQPYCSRGLHHIIIRNEYKLSGIINGIDYDFYNPATDRSLFKNYDFGCIEEKVLNKKSWQDELGLPVDGDTPMISIVSRLVGHKGLDLVIKVIEDILQKDVQLVVVGTGDQKYVDYFKYLEGKYPTKVRALVDEYSNENARRAYGASDIFVMPSKIEPCGISQMIASRYGSVPIVREVGGLKDSIRDFGCEGGGNGYTFTNYNPNDLSYQLNRAIRDYGNKAGWREKMMTCMSVDFTWNKPAEDYIKLYKSLCD